MVDDSREIISLTIKDKASLHAAYIPFVRNGGLFIASKKSYKPDDEVFVLLTLMDDKDSIPIAGRVIWITPPGAQGNRESGIGVQFSEQDNGAARNKIEGILAGMQQGERLTHTM